MGYRNPYRAGGTTSSRWAKFRIGILLRDGYQCRRCGRMADEVHHIVPVSQGGDEFDLENCESLCVSCHIDAHRRRRHRPAHVVEWDNLVKDLYHHDE